MVKTSTAAFSPGPGRNAIEQLLATATAALEHNRDTARACLIRASRLLRAGAEETDASDLLPRGGLAPWQVRRITVYINDHLAGRIQATDLAAQLDLSTSHFFRAFRQTFGEPPMMYVARQRMQLAQELMLRTDESLAHVALRCGLCDQAHFSRIFRRVVGATPREWRRRFANPNP